MSTQQPLLDTFDRLLAEQTPNFLRLYVNPFVAQACLCLGRYVQDTWHAGTTPAPLFQSFLANSFDEALSGAIKLARFSLAAEGRPSAGLVIDPEDRLGPLASLTIEGQGRIDFIPDLYVVRTWEPGTGDLRRFGFIVLVAPAQAAAEPALGALAVGQGPTPLLIFCVDRLALVRHRAQAAMSSGAVCNQVAHSRWDGSGEPSGRLGRAVPPPARHPMAHRSKLRPDIVVFDESFVRKDVPFGAFTARKALYDHWNKPGLWTFHSTTFQPNSVSSLHLVRCLQQDDPDFFLRLKPQLEHVAQDRAYRKSVFARQYSPSLARTTAAVGWDVPGIRAAGHYVSVQGRQVFDAVAGVACSIRGHNPPGYRHEMEKLAGPWDHRQAAARRLEQLTGLGHLVPAVSGASAVENALRLGLAAQLPKKYVLAFSGGFGGKTLLALTGTAQSSYKRGLDPLYENVLYIDPFRDSALADLEAALDRYPVGVVQLELIQAVGGVRAVPEHVVRYLQAHKRRRDYLLFVDEVQTGMYRTGPFIRSRELGIEPDLLTLGKGASDMMFPFAVTLYSERVREKLAARKADLPELLRQRCDYEWGYKTLVNVLDRAAEVGAAQKVREAGALFSELLSAGLSSCRAVRDVRVFGLLIGIELEVRRRPLRWLKKQAGSLYVMNLLRHKPWPALVGYCQYEPHVLKLTPPLSISLEEIHRLCEALTAVLRRRTYKLLPPLVGALARSSIKAKWEAYRDRRASRECLER
jgi:acetylornithine/succinyldiaminopimelate/putrescine aminotransferase